jgi:hypothetical protein
MKIEKILIQILFITVAMLGISQKAQAVACCSASGSDCIISFSPCELNGNYDYAGDLRINVNTFSPVEINLIGDVELNFNGDIFLNNQFIGANKKVIISGRAPAGVSRDGHDLIIDINGDMFIPGEGLTIDLSVPETSTGNGGDLTLNINGDIIVPKNINLNIFTFAGNANNLSGVNMPRGGLVEMDINGDFKVSSSSIIKTGTMSGNPTRGGNINFNNNGNLTNGSVELFVSSSLDRAGDITIDTNGNAKFGAHANGGNTSGNIYVDVNGDYYLPLCVEGNPIFEAKNGGTIDFSINGDFALTQEMYTRSGGVGLGDLNIDVNGDVYDCDCYNNGGLCNTALKFNNKNVIFDINGSCLNLPIESKCYSKYPSVFDITSAKPNGFYTMGEIIKVDVYFDGPVAIAGNPTLELETGATDRIATYSLADSILTIGKMTFVYNVQAGDESTDLDYTNVNSLSLNGGTIKNFNGTQNAFINLPDPGAKHSLGFNKDIIIDTTAPSAVVTAYDKNDAEIINGANILDSDATALKFKSVGGDSSGIFMNVVLWTTNDWTNTNQVNCGALTNCWVRIDSTPISFSINNGATWTNCSSNPACTITNPVGPISNATVKYRTQVLDNALNSTTTVDKSFIANAGNIAPTVSGLIVDTDYCANGINGIKFRWNFEDDEDGNGNQTAFQVDLTKDVIGPTCSINGAANLFVTAGNINASCFADFIDYGHSYNWTVIVRDSAGQDSDPVSSIFSIQPHQYPTANFSVTPNPPLQFQTVTFDASSLSACYDVLCSFEWNFGDGFSATGLTASHIYSGTGPFISTLKVTDFDDINHNCTASQNININSSKPTWNEVVPKTND